MEKILIVGGFGFLGQYIANEANKNKYQVVVCDIKPDAPIFNTGINVIDYNFLEASDEESINIFKNYDYLVFCGGRDDRHMPKGDAKKFFYEANVLTSQRLANLSSEAGVSKLIILGSYFSYFNRIWPEYKLAERHPYIYSRVEQERLSIEAAKNNLQVIFLEIPYVFGVIKGMQPLWKSLVKYINKTPVVFYTKGGTAFISVDKLAEACVGAIKNAKHGDCIPIAEKNMTWNEMINLILKTLNKKKPIVNIAWWVIKPFSIFLQFSFYLKGVQSGLNPYHFINIQSKKTYIDIDYCTNYLGFEAESLDRVFEETVKKCMK
ncbi:MAG: NAD(P)-dependent oxidoreductase [Bacteroidales bacterium]|nr:NAD(P)-dependent oxidoreductase [Bacteroidales bacterium]